MRRIKTAIIGQGRSGRDIHGRYLKTDNRYDVCAIVDELSVRRDIAAKEWTCPIYARYEDLFGSEDLDLVVNASFSHQHAPITADLLQHGFHVINEKPAASTAAEVRHLDQTAKENQKVLAFFQQSRFAPYYEQIKSVLASGKLGRIVQISLKFNGFARRWDWQCSRSFQGGSLFNTGPHPLDQALDLIDFKTEGIQIFCQMDQANTFGDAEDYVKLVMRGQDIPLIDLEISSCDAYADQLYHIQGTRGGLKGTMTSLNWRYFKTEEAPVQKLITSSLQTKDGLPMYCGEKLSWYDESWATEDARVFTDAVGRFYDHVYQAVTMDKPLPITAGQIEKQLHVIETCHEQNQK